ncbi:MAG: DUF6089 family protein [Flavitalea sp.]
MPRFILLIFFLPVFLFAQKKINIGLFGGFANYNGDLQAKRFTLNQAGGTFAGFLSYEIAPKLLIRGTLQLAKIGADDKKGLATVHNRNLNFHSKIYEASLVADYSFNDLEYQYFSPYVFGGLALFRFNPYTYDSSGNIAFLRLLGTEGQGLKEYPDRKVYSMYQFSVPFGVGVRLKISQNVVIGYEIGLRKTFTDYLDDVSTTYVDEATLASQRGRKSVELAFRSNELKGGPQTYPLNGTVRGGSNYKDWYYFSGISVSVGLTNELGKLFARKVGLGSVACPRGVL